jgi:hypothetical protein
MLSRWYTRFTRSVLVAVLLAFCFVAIPQPASSAPAAKVELKIQIAAVKRSESVSIRGLDFPTRTSFTVRIGDTKYLAEKGEVVGKFTTDKSGNYDATYTIPEAMQSKRVIGLRIDGDAGYYAYTWFMNTTQSGLIVDKETVLPEMTFAEVVQNTSVKILAQNLAPNSQYRVRVGPHASFYRDYVALTSLTSSEDGKIEASIDLPEALQEAEAEFISVRLDAVSVNVGASRSVFSTFRNQDGGAYVPAQELIKVVPCTVISARSLPTMYPGQDFDAVWTVKNTGNFDWDASTVSYRFYSGARIHKFESLYGIPFEVKRGLAFPITVDMQAPEELGWHSATWELVLENRTLCRMGVVFFVKSNP